VDELLNKNANVKNVLGDDRFKDMFEDKDYVRDKSSIEYKHMKPVSFDKKGDNTIFRFNRRRTLVMMRQTLPEKA
jgi:hypothetical protein